MRVKLWGAGGGGNAYTSPTRSAQASFGGAGGYTVAEIAVTPGQSYILVVGEGGKKSQNKGNLPTYGGGGPGGVAGTYTGGSGGGLTGIFLESVSQLSAIAIAGGGGGGAGGSYKKNAGGGGGLNGQNGQVKYGSGKEAGGGTQTAGGKGSSGPGGKTGTDGQELKGGTGANGGAQSGAGGGGGGGYFGGGGGKGQTTNPVGSKQAAVAPSWDDNPGGGGSGYCWVDLLSCATHASNYNNLASIASDTPDYVPGIAQGGAGNFDGGNGLIIVEFANATGDYGAPIQCAEPKPTCSITNICGQAIAGVLTDGVCQPPTGADINASCVANFTVSNSTIVPGGKVEFSWKLADLPANIASRCGFVDLTTPTPRPVPGLQNLSVTADRARITNIQRTTRFCLVCQFYDLTTRAILGETARHQWVRVMTLGEQ